MAGTIAKKLQAEVADGLSRASKKPHLVGYLANEDPAARMYADWTNKTCTEKYVKCKGSALFAILFLLSKVISSKPEIAMAEEVSLPHHQLQPQTARMFPPDPKVTDQYATTLLF